MKGRTKKSIYVNFVEAINLLSKDIDYDSLIKKLKDFQYELERKHEREIEQKIFRVIDSVMKINLAENNGDVNNLKGKRSVEKQYAICFACTILKDEFVFPLNKIAGLFNICQSNVSRKIKFVRELNPKSQIDSQILEKYKKILSEIK